MKKILSLPPKQALSDLMARHLAPCRICLEAEVSVTASALWIRLSDLGSLHRYMPFISRIDVIHPAQEVGVGSERICHLPGLGALQERVLWWEDGHGFAFTAEGGRVPIRDHLGVILIHPVSPASSTVQWKQYFEPRFGPLGWLFPFAMKQLMRRAIASIAKEAGGTATFRLATQSSPPHGH